MQNQVQRQMTCYPQTSKSLAHAVGHNAEQDHKQVPAHAMFLTSRTGLAVTRTVALESEDEGQVVAVSRETPESLLLEQVGQQQVRAALDQLPILFREIHRRVRRLPEKSLPKYRLPIEALTALIVGLTGHLGGFLSGVNGPG